MGHMQPLQIQALEMEIESDEEQIFNQMEVKLVLDIQYHDITSMMRYDATVPFIMYGIVKVAGKDCHVNNIGGCNCTNKLSFLS